MLPTARFVNDCTHYIYSYGYAKHADSSFQLTVKVKHCRP